MAKSSSSSAATASPSKASTSDTLIELVWIGAVVYGVGLFLINAYEIRLQAIKEFGPVIHEFDPYFNWRATQVSLSHCWYYLFRRSLVARYGLSCRAAGLGSAANSATPGTPRRSPRVK